MAEAIEIAERTGSATISRPPTSTTPTPSTSPAAAVEAREVAEQGVARVEDRIELERRGLDRDRCASSGSTSPRSTSTSASGSAPTSGAARAGSGHQGINRAHALLRRRSWRSARARGRAGAGGARAGRGAAPRRARAAVHLDCSRRCSAEAEVRRGGLDSARAAIDDGIDRIQFCSEDGGPDRAHGGRRDHRRGGGRRARPRPR